jgi:hypothetical protein
LPRQQQCAVEQHRSVVRIPGHGGLVRRSAYLWQSSSAPARTPALPLERRVVGR